MRYNELYETNWKSITKPGETPICWFSGLTLWTREYILKNKSNYTWMYGFTPSVEHVIPRFYKPVGGLQSYVFKYERILVVSAAAINNLVGNMPVFIKLEYKKKLHEHFKGQTEPTTKDANYCEQIRDSILKNYGFNFISDFANEWWQDPKYKSFIEKEQQAIKEVSLNK